MRILFVHAIGKNKFGGGEKWVLTAAQGLQGRGHTVYLGCRPRSVLAARAEESGIEVCQFNILSDLSLFNMIKMSRFLKREKIDVVVSKNRDFFVSAIAARMARTPAVIARHGLPLRKNILKHVYVLNKFAHGIIVNAQATKNLYVRKKWFPPDFIRVIYNGVEVNTGCEAMPFSTMYPEKKIVLSIGRLSMQKGYTYLIDATAQLRKKRDDFTVIVLGEGKLRKSLVEQARAMGVSKAIQFPGFVRNVCPYLKGCDLFVLPSLYEGLSNAALEAMMFCKPVILTDVNGSREIVEHGKSGMIVPAKNPTALAVAMDTLLSDDSLRKQYGNESLRFVRQHFTQDAMVDNLERFLHETLRSINLGEGIR